MSIYCLSDEHEGQRCSLFSQVHTEQERGHVSETYSSSTVVIVCSLKSPSPGLEFSLTPVASGIQALISSFVNWDSWFCLVAYCDNQTALSIVYFTEAAYSGRLPLVSPGPSTGQGRTSCPLLFFFLDFESLFDPGITSRFRER